MTQWCTRLNSWTDVRSLLRYFYGALPSTFTVNRESLFLHTCNWAVYACLDIKVSSLWGGLTTSMSVQSAVNMKRGFIRLNMQVSVLLFFSTAGGMGASTAVAYKYLAFLLSLKWNILYSTGWACYAVIFTFPFCTPPSSALGALVLPLVTPLGIMFQPPLTCGTGGGTFWAA